MKLYFVDLGEGRLGNGVVADGPQDAADILNRSLGAEYTKDQMVFICEEGRPSPSNVEYDRDLGLYIRK